MERLINRRPVNFKSIFKFDHLEKSVQVHLKNVYGTLCTGIMAAALGVYLHLAGVLQCGVLSVLGTLGCLLYIVFTHDDFGVRTACFIGLGLFSGVDMGPLIEAAQFKDPSIIPTALLATSSIFLAFTLSALFNRSRSYLYLGGVLIAALNILILGTFMNIFIGSRSFMQFELYAGLALFSLLILFDTQLIVEKRRMGDTDFVWHALDLFLDVLNIFRRIVVALLQKEEKNE